MLVFFYCIAFVNGREFHDIPSVLFNFLCVFFSLAPISGLPSLPFRIDGDELNIPAGMF